MCFEIGNKVAVIDAAIKGIEDPNNPLIGIIFPLFSVDQDSKKFMNLESFWY